MIFLPLRIKIQTMQVVQNDVIKCCKMMSSNVVLLHTNNCCVVLEAAICEDLYLHVTIFRVFHDNAGYRYHCTGILPLDACSCTLIRGAAKAHTCYPNALLLESKWPMNASIQLHFSILAISQQYCKYELM